MGNPKYDESLVLMSTVAKLYKVIAEWDVKITPLSFNEDVRDDWDRLFIFLTIFVDVLENNQLNNETTPGYCFNGDILKGYLKTFEKLGYEVKSNGRSMPNSRLALLSGLVVLKLIEANMLMRFYEMKK